MRAERLRRTKDIDLVRAAGEQRSDRHFSLRARRNDLPVVRVAVASPRAVGTAVRRNRARRRLREIVRTEIAARGAAPGTDLFLVARGPALSATPEALRAAVRRQLESILGGTA